MTLALTLPLSELELVGYIGRFQPRDWPLRLMPVYRGRTEQLYLLPPVEENAGSLQGRRITAERLEELEEEGELTLLPEPLAARSDHLLWMDETGPRYMPRAEAEKALDASCVQSVTRAMEAGLRKRVAREQLFRALRARPTAVVYALLSLHFQLQDDIEQVRPLREDLTRMATSPANELEQRLLEVITSTGKGLTQEEATAIASELRRARRESLARSLLDASQVRASVRWAAQPSIELSWSTVGRVPA